MDKKTIEDCRKGKRKAQLKVYDAYCNAMFAVACSYMKDAEEAKDMVQEGFLKVFENIAGYSDSHSFGGWLKRIVINTCIDRLRKRGLETVSLSNIETPEDYDEDENWNVPNEISVPEVIDQIKLLDIKYATVIKLYLIEGYDHSEISQIMGINEATSKTRLRRAKKLVMDSFKEKEQ